MLVGGIVATTWCLGRAHHPVAWSQRQSCVYLAPFISPEPAWRGVGARRWLAASGAGDDTGRQQQRYRWYRLHHRCRSCSGARSHPRTDRCISYPRWEIENKRLQLQPEIAPCTLQLTGQLRYACPNMSRLDSFQMRGFLDRHHHYRQRCFVQKME